MCQMRVGFTAKTRRRTRRKLKPTDRVRRLLKVHGEADDATRQPHHRRDYRKLSAAFSLTPERANRKPDGRRRLSASFLLCILCRQRCNNKQKGRKKKKKKKKESKVLLPFQSAVVRVKSTWASSFSKDTHKNQHRSWSVLAGLISPRDNLRELISHTSTLQSKHR